MEFSTEQQLFLAIRSLDTKLDSVIRRLNSEEQAEWLDTKDTCSMLGCTDRHLRNLMAEGTIAGIASVMSEPSNVLVTSFTAAKL